MVGLGVLKMVLIVVAASYAENVGKSAENVGQGMAIALVGIIGFGILWFVWDAIKDGHRNRHSAPPDFNCFLCGHQHEHGALPQYYQLCDGPRDGEEHMCQEPICSGCGGSVDWIGEKTRRKGRDPRWKGKDEVYCPKCNWWMPDNFDAGKSVPDSGWDGKR